MSLKAKAKKAQAELDKSLQGVLENLGKFAEGAAIDGKDAVENVFAEMITDAAFGTPVDKGRARAGWHRAVSATGGTLSFPPVSPTTGKPIDPNEIRQGKREGAFLRDEDPDRIDLTAINRVRYIVLLETGLVGRQAIGGFARPAVVRAAKRVRQAIESKPMRGVK